MSTKDAEEPHDASPSEIFSKFAQYYDLIHVEKEYEKECDLLEEIFRRFSKERVRSIIDIGAGTGGHSIPLARRGYQVLGIDRSPVMVKMALQKAGQAGVDTRFEVQDMKSIGVEKNFDAAICMFGSFGYLLTGDDIRAMLLSLKSALREEGGALFIFDFQSAAVTSRAWTGSPKLEWNIRQKGRWRGISLVRSVFDPMTHQIENLYHFIILEDDMVRDEFEERHTVRVFYLPEVEEYLRSEGFRLVRFCRFTGIDKVPDPETANIVAIARLAG